MSSLKVNNIGINRDANPQVLYVALKNEKNEAVNVHVTLQPHQHLDNLTVHEIEQLGLAEAKKFFA